MKSIQKFLGAFFLTQCFFIYAQQSDESAEKTFAIGNLEDKTRVLQDVEKGNLSSKTLLNTAAKYIIRYQNLFFDDEEFRNFTILAIEKFDVKDENQLQDIKKIYADSQSRTVKITILKRFTELEEFPTFFVASLSQFFTDYVEKNDESTYDELRLIVDLVIEHPNIAYFDACFKSLLFVNDKDIKTKARLCIDELSGDYEKKILTLIETGDIQSKILALQLVLENDDKSDFFKAEIAEKALFVSIKDIDDVSQIDESIVQLQLDAVSELRRVAWTRSSSIVKSFFEFALKEFEASKMSEDQFIIAIESFSELASTEASVYLSEYLSECNRQFEENTICSEPIVLSVISILGRLGNHVAFDSLLYATYLPYSDPVLDAARDALVKLKW